MYRSNNYLRTPLTNEAIHAVAPSVFAATAMSGVSARYSFIPTVKVVDGLRDAGWLPVLAQENRIRLEDKRGFQKHMIRFQMAGDRPDLKVGDSVFELNLVNSHDRSSGYSLIAALYRLVCSNGMMVADTTAARINVRHTGLEVDEIVKQSLEMVKEVPVIAASVGAMQARQLSRVEQVAFAEAAILLRHEDVSVSPVSPDQLLEPRRSQDRKADMWTTLNNVQENIIKGGVRARNTNGKRFRTREVKSIAEDIRLNRALWHLADALRQGGNPVSEVRN